MADASPPNKLVARGGGTQQQRTCIRYERLVDA